MRDQNPVLIPDCNREYPVSIPDCNREYPVSIPNCNRTNNSMDPKEDLILLNLLTFQSYASYGRSGIAHHNTR
jgi:hypothetical protein